MSDPRNSIPEDRARSPYRGGTDVLARYTLRPYPAYLSGLVVSILVFPLLWFRFAASSDRTLTWVILGIALLAAPLVSMTRSSFRVGGRDRELRIFRDRVEVPSAFRRAPIRIPLAHLRAQIHFVEGRMNGVRVDQPWHLVLDGPGVRRTLRAELFSSAQAMVRAAADIHRLQAGLDLEPPGDDRAPRDAYDDKLDRELDRLS